MKFILPLTDGLNGVITTPLKASIRGRINFIFLNKTIKLIIFSTSVYYYFIKIENAKSGVFCLLVCLFGLFIFALLGFVVLHGFLGFFVCLFLVFFLLSVSMSD